MKQQRYLLRTTIDKKHYFYSSHSEIDGQLHVEWVKFQFNAKKFASPVEIASLKEEHPVIQGRNVIYR